MLYLSRKLGESIVVNNTIEITVIEVRGKTVKLGFDFPPDATVLRKELYDKIMAENVAASGSGDGDVDFMEGDFDLSHLDAPLPPKSE
jgi:carbon storage regulator